MAVKHTTVKHTTEGDESRNTATKQVLVEKAKAFKEKYGIVDEGDIIDPEDIEEQEVLDYGL